jgi:hypothetical protein
MVDELGWSKTKKSKEKDVKSGENPKEPSQRKRSTKVAETYN